MHTQRQTPSDRPTRGTTARRLGAGQARHLDARGGELRVLEGRVWLTCAGALGDHLVSTGERTVIGVDDDAVIEPYDAGAEVRYAFIARRRSLGGAIVEMPLRVLASFAATAARGLAVLADRAAAGARRAEGQIA